MREGVCWSEEVRPLTLRLSAALMRLVRLASGTEVSPLYIKSTMHWTSHPRMSLRTMMGCLQGLSTNIFWKYGLHADKTTLCALRDVSSQTRVQSTRASLCKRASKALRTWDWWLFHLKE